MSCCNKHIASCNSHKDGSCSQNCIKCPCTCLTIKPKKQKLILALLNGRNEVPPNSSDATGVLIGILSAEHTRLDYALLTTGLVDVISAHFHLGVKGVNGGIVKNISAGPFSGSIFGSWTANDMTQPLTPELVQKLKCGGLYVNVHTERIPSGEIRGQTNLVCVTPPKC